VAEPAAVVTDTHPLLFHAAGGARLSKRAARLFQAAEERRAIVYVPVAVMWETSLLARVGRVELGRSVEEFFTDLFSNAAYQAFDLTPAQRL
jgi:PIN domain nuclease of toxin-antitoxin system